MCVYVCADRNKYLRLTFQLKIFCGTVFVIATFPRKLFPFCVTMQPSRCCSEPQNVWILFVRLLKSLIRKMGQTLTKQKQLIQLFCDLRVSLWVKPNKINEHISGHETRNNEEILGDKIQPYSSPQCHFFSTWVKCNLRPYYKILSCQNVNL